MSVAYTRPQQNKTGFRLKATFDYYLVKVHVKRLLNRAVCVCLRFVGANGMSVMVCFLLDRPT